VGTLRRLACGWIIILVAEALGCSVGGSAERHQPFVPDSADARAGLEKALKVWQNSAVPLPGSFGGDGFRFVDLQRTPEQRLLSFQVVGETKLETARQFTVRLSLSAGDEPLLVRYNVFGRDPTWVYRLEDLEMLMHWEHKMDTPSDSADLKR
jgi:hypothetical protein